MPFLEAVGNGQVPTWLTLQTQWPIQFQWHWFATVYIAIELAEYIEINYIGRRFPDQSRRTPHTQ